MHILILIFTLLFSIPVSIYAQATPTIVPTAAQQLPTTTPIQAQQQPQQTPTTALPAVPGRPTGGTTLPGGAVVPTHISTANCDVCGYCNGMTADQVPGRWASCRQCIYAGLGEGEINPLDNKTIQGTAEGIPTPDLFHIYTDLGCISTRPGEFAAQMSSFFFSVIGGIAFLVFIYGAGIIATSRSDPGRLEQGKKAIYGAIAGLLFALFSVFIIRFIAGGIGIPGIGGN